MFYTTRWQGVGGERGGRGPRLGWAIAALIPSITLQAFLQRSDVHSTVLGTRDIMV